MINLVIVNKKGQMTIFVVIAILIFLVLAIVFTVSSDARSIIGLSKESSRIDLVYDLEQDIEDCLEQATALGLSYIESQGGYTNLSRENFISQADMNIGLFPRDLEYIEKDLSNYVTDLAQESCLEEEYSGYIVTRLDRLDVDITTKESGFSFVANWPIELTNEDGTDVTKLDTFSGFYSSKFLQLYKSAQKFVETQPYNDYVEQYYYSGEVEIRSWIIEEGKYIVYFSTQNNGEEEYFIIAIES